MRKIIAAAVVGLIALSGQAIAKETAKAASAPAAVRSSDRATTAADSNQLMGLGLIPTILIGIAGITLIALVVDSQDDNNSSP
ncbi:MAG: hypothetical protein JWM33_3089 [Caulobacteraceae bacterium]|nr:hypothetical protein [Caulobacteraceae bacterium]